MGKGHLAKLAVFRCLNTTAIKKTEMSTGKSINQDSSGTLFDEEFELFVGDDEGAKLVAVGDVCVGVEVAVSLGSGLGV